MKKKIICVSDTHGLHRKLDVPDGDILIHAGDIDHAFGTQFVNASILGRELNNPIEIYLETTNKKEKI